MERTQVIIWIFIVFLGCSDSKVEKSIPRVESDFKSDNSVHLNRFGINRNISWKYGRIGDSISNIFQDSVGFWNRKVPELNEVRKHFEILVDTISKLPIKLDEWELGDFADTTNFSIKTIYEEYDRKYAAFNALPVYIINTDTTDHILEFQDGSVFMIYEALDSLGTWRPIEYWEFTHFCGNSYYELVLKPDYFLVTKVLEYSGKYKTQLRLKIKNFDHIMYSHPFMGYINYSQFDNRLAIEHAKKYTENRYLDKPDSIEFYTKEYLDEIMLMK